MADEAAKGLRLPAAILSVYGVFALIVTWRFDGAGIADDGWNRAYATPLLVLALVAEALALAGWSASASNPHTARRLVLGGALGFTAWTAAMGWLLWLHTLFAPDGPPGAPSFGPVIVLGGVLAFVLSALPAVPTWLPRLIPAAFAALYMLGYLDNVTWEGGGDPDPGVWLLSGILIVGAQSAAVVFGDKLRHRWSVTRPQR